MGLLDAMKEILGYKPVNVGKLNRQATHSRPAPPVVRRMAHPLEGVEVTQEYKTVVKLIECGAPFIFVSGKAGTGKSTLIHYLRHTLKKRLVVVAPTGIAALNVKGTTIHSFFHLPPRIVTDTDIQEVRNRELYAHLDLLVVDEISMVRADLMDAIAKFLQINGKVPGKPFGGVQILVVGDLFQLPPVVTRKEEGVLFARKYTSPFFFSAKSLQECELISIELQTVFRQRDVGFTEMLNKIRLAEQLGTAIPAINAAGTRQKQATDRLLTLTCTNVVADKANQKKLEQISGTTVVFKGTVEGKFSIPNEKLPSPLNLVLKPGAQVMFTKNDEQKRWVNGTLGRVVKIKENSIQVELITDSPGAFHEVQRVEWESFKYEYDYVKDKIYTVVVGRYRQFPLMLAWAVTIHKSQGKTLERVRIDLGNGAFASGQVYVALSRCRSLSDIELARAIRPNEVRCDERIKRFYLSLAQAQQEDKAEAGE